MLVYYTKKGEHRLERGVNKGRIRVVNTRPKRSGHKDTAAGGRKRDDGVSIHCT